MNMLKKKKKTKQTQKALLQQRHAALACLEGALRLCYWRLRPGLWGSRQSTGYHCSEG